MPGAGRWRSSCCISGCSALQQIYGKPAKELAMKMSTPNKTRGGQIATRGLLVQTIVALLDITQADPPFTEITLEPMVGDDQFDFLCKNACGSHAV
jgi:hypothetical protein